MRIRPATSTDSRMLAVLGGRLLPNYPAPDPASTLIAEDDNKAAVGYLSGVVNGAYAGPGCPVRPPHGYIQAVAVDPAARHRGVGRALVQGFIERARSERAAWVFALPDEGDGVEGRVEFFTRCGFAAVSDPGEPWPAMGRWTS